MPFKIVETIEKGTPLLTTVPAQWEQRGTLYWPRKNEAILIKAEDSTPETNWKSMPCILKRNNIPNYESSEQQIALMSDMSDTDTNQEIIAKTQRPKKSTTQINLNDLVTNCLSMCVRIWLEVGHACEPRRSASGRALALDWRVWVRGVSGRDISTFVHKVVFHLHPAAAFVYPKRVLQEPPYEIQESGCASIDIPIHVYLKYSNRPKKISLRYSLQIENNSKSNSESRCIYYDFANPSEQLCEALMSGGGELVPRSGTLVPRSGTLVPRSGAPARAERLLLLLSDDERRLTRPRRYKFVEPVHCKHGPKKRAKSYIFEEICSKCGNSIYLDFRKQLRSVAMTEDEITCVSQLYWSYTNYEKSVGSLTLPPISDSIYKVPELPASLRRALKEVEEDYTLP